MANVLEKIVADKAEEVARRQKDMPLSQFIEALTPSDRDFLAALKAPNCQFIFECKKASPSKGLIREDFDLDAIAKVYQRHAACISVLTDNKYFQGEFAYLSQVRSQVTQPVICKDFFIDPYQVYLARYYGADAILLMLSVLDDDTYRTLSALAKQYDMTVLTEVSNEEEVARANALGAELIGINNRNLRDLSTDLDTTARLRPLIHDKATVISESGIYSYQDVKRLSPLCDGFLVGSSIMMQKDIEAACRDLTLGQNKVCGLTNTQDASAAYQAGSRYGGLIFAKASPRYVDFDTAKAIMHAEPRLDYVAVVTTNRADEISKLVDALNVHAVQLHGEPSPSEIEEIVATVGDKVTSWLAKDGQDAKNATLPKGIARFVFDAKAASQFGGTGTTFDWQTLNDTQVPYMLAGGINPDNCQAASALGALGLDLNSGVETAPGKKSATHLNTVFTLLRSY